MDILDTMGEGETVEIKTKEMIEEITIKGQIMDSDEEGNSIHLSPQTVLETTDTDVQYAAIRQQEGGVITYRVVQVDDSSADDASQIVTTSGTSTTVPQVLTSSIYNGQLYVFGSPEMLANPHPTARPIVPREASLDTSSSIVTSIKKRDERRRATHNEVERRRRDKINNWIAKLATIIPDQPHEIKACSGHYDGQSKGGILAKACDYILDLKDIREKYEALLKEHKETKDLLESVQHTNAKLEFENKELKATLKKHSIYVVND